MPQELIQYAGIALLLSPMVIGYTQAIKDQFPVLKTLAPLVAILVSVILYYSYKILPGELFTLLYVAGGSMGVYKLADKIGGKEVIVN